MNIEDFLDSKAERKLIHIEMIHEIADQIAIGYGSQHANGIEQLNQSINDINDFLFERFLDLHQRVEFSRVYLDSHDGIYSRDQDVIDNSHSYHKPTLALMDNEVILTPTEHPGHAKLLSIFASHFGSIREANDCLYKLKGTPIETILKGVDAYPDHLKSSIDEFLSVQTEFDLNAARDYWIGENINSTLQPVESGILFLGRGHNSNLIKNKLEGIEYLRFKPLDEMLRIAEPYLQSQYS